MRRGRLLPQERVDNGCGNRRRFRHRDSGRSHRLAQFETGYGNAQSLGIPHERRLCRQSGHHRRADGKLLYFPDPRDITAESAPINLGDGWWLNRQGISANSVFTTYTFSQYAALPRVPTAAALKAAIIPGAKVTEMRELPFTPAEAVAHLDSVRSLLRIR